MLNASAEFIFIVCLRTSIRGVSAELIIRGYGSPPGKGACQPQQALECVPLVVRSYKISVLPADITLGLQKAVKGVLKT